MRFATLITVIAVCCASAPAAVGAQAIPAFAGYDFDYSIGAPGALQPLSVFNDGLRTYIEQRPGVSGRVESARVQGAYLVVDGVAAQLNYVVGDARFAIVHKRSVTARASNELSPPSLNSLPIALAALPLQTSIDGATRSRAIASLSMPTGSMSKAAPVAAPTLVTQAPVKRAQSKRISLAFKKGSELEFVLPEFARANQLELSWAARGPSLASKSIVVEDESAQVVMQRLLETVGMRLVQVADTQKYIVVDGVAQ
jgi:hypothetical protein